MSLNTYKDLNDIPDQWDLIVIGGGVTGAGVLREASRIGLRCVLLEQADYSWGTSSRSAKLVHGGLRYLKEGKIWLTRDSVRERERLLRDGPGLVEPIGFLTPIYKGKSPGRLALSLGLGLYDLMGGKKRHEHLSRDGFVSLAPDISRRGLKGGFRFMDAQVDDSRLTLRLIDESVQDGAAALNYTSVRRVNRDRANRVVGVTAQDVETGLTRDLLSKAVINATGAWAENFSPYPDRKKSLRPLRGSHLIIPSDILNLRDSISFNHPGDNRPLYLCPWEGAIILGTTDIDHDEDLMKAPSITREEISYLLEGFRTYFPSVNLSMDKAVSTFAGIRPVLSEGDRLASQESREHEVWSDNGLITVTGGKLTTFRRLAWDTLNEAAPYLGGEIKLEPDPSVFKQATIKNKAQVNVSADILRRILGRYGQAGEEIFSEAQEQDLSEIPGTNSIWAELPFVCRREQVRKLSDLLLRRVRIGLLCPEGARNHMPRIRKLCMAPLNWDDEKWRRQEIDYLESWQQAHGVQSNPSEMQMDK